MSAKYSIQLILHYYILRVEENIVKPTVTVCSSHTSILLIVKDILDRSPGRHLPQA